MRLDVSVNMLTYQALKNNKITVFGGEQTRPNIHIKDMANIYIHFLENPNLESGYYNAGFENMKIIDIAKKVQNCTGAEIIITETNDPRSYRQDSSKLLKTGFKPLFSVQNAIDEITEAFRANELPSGDNCYTVKWMKKLNLCT
jgi:nucleoside-diphosphate-sugar epimerase